VKTQNTLSPKPLQGKSPLLRQKNRTGPEQRPRDWAFTPATRTARRNRPRRLAPGAAAG
jgi:hypothetical protein